MTPGFACAENIFENFEKMFYKRHAASQNKSRDYKMRLNLTYPKGELTCLILFLLFIAC
jgi:hypothetical protein